VTRGGGAAARGEEANGPAGLVDADDGRNFSSAFRRRRVALAGDGRGNLGGGIVAPPGSSLGLGLSLGAATRTVLRMELSGGLESSRGLGNGLGLGPDWAETTAVAEMTTLVATVYES
jgi:hypothetical protein